MPRWELWFWVSADVSRTSSVKEDPVRDPYDHRVRSKTSSLEGFWHTTSLISIRKTQQVSAHRRRGRRRSEGL